MTDTDPQSSNLRLWQSTLICEAHYTDFQQKACGKTFLILEAMLIFKGKTYMKMVGEQNRTETPVEPVLLMLLW